MNIAERFNVLFAAVLATASIIQPTRVSAEKNYKDYDIEPSSVSEKKLTEVEIDNTGVSFYIPSSWEEDKEYNCYYPGKEDESVYFYYFDSSDKKKFTPKQDIDDVVDYLLNVEPEHFNSTLSKTSTEYYDVGGHYIAKVSFDRTVKDDGETLKWREVNYIIPVNEKYIMNLNVLLDAGKKQTYLKGEEALILSIEDHGKKVFDDYIRTQTTQTQTAAIGTVTRNTGTATVSTPAPTPQPVVNVHAYVLNTNTGKFHLPNCSSVGQMKASNRWDVEMTREEVISMGYVPCKRCNP